MSTEELQERANLYAQTVIDELRKAAAEHAEDLQVPIEHWTRHFSKVDIARAFVMGYAAALEDASRTVRRKR